MTLLGEGGRFIRKNPFLFIGGAFILALGLGTSAAISSALWSANHLQVQGVTPGRLRTIGAATASHALQPVNWKTVSILNAGAAYAKPVGASLKTTSGRTTIQLAAISSNFFGVLTKPLEAGSPFSRIQDEGSSRVVILSDALARTLFGSANAAINRQLKINSLDLTVSAVAPRSFRGLFGQNADVWVPAHLVIPYYFDAGSLPAAQDNLWTTLPVFYVITRSSNAAAFGHPSVNGEMLEALDGLETDPLQRQQVRHWASITLFLALTLTGACCLGAAGLLLARVPSQFNEVRLRRVLGASAARICLESLSGPLCIGVSGLLGAVLVAIEVTRLLPAYAGASWPVLAAALLAEVPVTATVVILIGLAPALRLLKESGAPKASYTGSPVKHTSRILEVIVVAQLACCICVCMAAASLGVSAARIASEPLGFQPNDRSVLSVGVVASQMVSYSTDSRGGSPLIRAYDRVLRRITSLPGVSGAALAVPAPLSATPNAVRVTNPNALQTVTRTVRLAAVTPGYFSVTGTRLKEGRALTTGLLGADPAEAVVNQAFANQVFGVRSAIGRPLRVTFPQALGELVLEVTVVGIAEDQHLAGPDHLAEPLMYVPLAGNVATIAVPVDLIVQGQLPLFQLQSAAGMELNAAFPSLGVMHSFHMDERLKALSADDSRRFFVAATGAAAIACVAFASLYSSLAYFVRFRRRELAIRISCGATAKGIFSMVMRKAAAAGAAALALSAFGWLFLSQSVFSDAPLKTAVMVAGAGMVLVLFAALLPALQASRTPPARWLRE